MVTHQGVSQSLLFSETRDLSHDPRLRQRTKLNSGTAHKRIACTNTNKRLCNTNTKLILGSLQLFAVDGAIEITNHSLKSGT